MKKRKKKSAFFTVLSEVSILLIITKLQLTVLSNYCSCTVMSNLTFDISNFNSKAIRIISFFGTKFRINSCISEVLFLDGDLCLWSQL